jgi:hypothetical protein
VAGPAEEKTKEGVGAGRKKKGGAPTGGVGRPEREKGEASGSGRAQGGKEKRASWATEKKWAAPGEKETGPRKGRVGPQFRKGERWAGLGWWFGLPSLLFFFSPFLYLS